MSGAERFVKSQKEPVASGAVGREKEGWQKGDTHLELRAARDATPAHPRKGLPKEKMLPQEGAFLLLPGRQQCWQKELEGAVSLTCWGLHQHSCSPYREGVH